MKDRFFLLLLVLFVGHWMSGQEIHTDLKQCLLKSVGDSVVFSMELTVTVTNMDSRGSVELIPIVRLENQEKKLLPVVLNGKKRQRLYERVQAIEMRRGLKPVSIYHVYEVEDNKPSRIDYRYAIIRESWMTNAELVLQKRYLDGSGDVKSEEFTLLNPAEQTPVPPMFQPVQSPSITSVPVHKTLQLKGIYTAPESDAMDARNQKELSFDIDEARVMANINPQILSIRELYMVAMSYKADPEKFYKVIDISVQVYPANPVANLNAASAAIERGQVKQAEYYLRMALHDTVAYKNCRGAYELLVGNYYEGIRLLKSAKADGSEEAAYNLKVFFEYQQGEK
ncbi:MAG: DUF3868 domain-containing protein [Parabacteroides sp.]